MCMSSKGGEGGKVYMCMSSKGGGGGDLELRFKSRAISKISMNSEDCQSYKLSLTI